MEKFQYKFLIGGQDLEMIEICKLLSKFDLQYINNELNWANAKLSSYSSYFNDIDYFVGIELTEDISRPLNYIEIDHHNNNKHKPSSLLQIIDLLKEDMGIDVEISREISLIAANDSGYIPAMEAINATKEEINDIRLRDRKAQGVTEEDELRAQKSIDNNLETIKGVTVVNSLTTKFSTITDRLYPYKQLLIYTDNELTYYGTGVDKLVLKYEDLIKNKKAYTGGGDSGYFGINYATDKKLINNILKIIAMEPLSYHIFMFPFKFGSESEKNDEILITNFIGQFDIKQKNGLKRDNENSDKEKERFYWDKPKDDLFEKYNQKKYFHDFVHPVLFEDEKKSIISFEKEPNLKYRIEINKKIINEKNYHPLELSKEKIDKQPDEYKLVVIDLQIQKVTLDLYEYGIGIFSFHLEYFPGEEVTKRDLLDNVLLINQYGRRIYPPFLDTHYGDFEFVDNSKLDNVLEGTKFRVLPKAIKILKREEDVIIATDWECFKKDPDNNFFLIPDHILYFLNIKRHKELRDSYYFTSVSEKQNNECTEKNIKISPILDDRMFVMSWLGAYQLTQEFTKDKLRIFEEKRKYGYVLSDVCNTTNVISQTNSSYQTERSFAFKKSQSDIGFLNNDFWYMYVFADSSEKTCQNEIKQQQIIKNHTYDRWINFKTLYGISRYSFVVLSAPINCLKKVNSAFIATHFKTIYFKMVSLVLIQRSLILMNSKEINETFSEESDKRTNNIDKKYGKYLEFINKYFHREISTQEQGIELYDMLIDHLRVEVQAKELEKEYQNLFSLIKIKRDEEQSKRMKGFTIIGTAFAIPTLLISLSDSSFFSDKTSWRSTLIFIIVMVSATACIMYGLLYRKENKNVLSALKINLSLSYSMIIIGVLIIIGYLLINKMCMTGCIIASQAE